MTTQQGNSQPMRPNLRRLGSTGLIALCASIGLHFVIYAAVRYWPTSDQIEFTCCYSQRTSPKQAPTHDLKIARLRHQVMLSMHSLHGSRPFTLSLPEIEFDPVLFGLPWPVEGRKI